MNIGYTQREETGVKDVINHPILEKDMQKEDRKFVEIYQITHL